ncbi:hypothetical protein FQN49_006821 [Arthroderma sp. PD_2]|nr:hypothetical protein FQN49_006821 [Arthroderma sp. PD_2]
MENSANQRPRRALRPVYPLIPAQDHAEQGKSGREHQKNSIPSRSQLTRLDRPVLREQLLAAHLQSAAHPAPPPPRPQPGVAAHLQAAAAAAGAGGQRDHINIDPAISGMSSGQQVHTSAGMLAQPLQAQVQRAFRQRKEGYIRKLEEQVKEYEMLLENYKAIQAENYQLREYIISLQSRLIDSQNEVPELPGNIDLTQPRPEPTMLTSAGQQQQQGQQGQGQQSHQQGGSGAGGQPGASGTQAELNSLNRIAVAGLGMRKHQHEEAAFLGQSGNFSKRTRQDGQDDAQGEQPKSDQI